MSSVASSSATSSMSSTVTMPINLLVFVRHRQRHAVEFPEQAQRFLAVVRRRQHRVVAVEQRPHRRVERREQEPPHADVVDQPAVVVDDENHVQRFAVVAVLRGCNRAPRARSTPDAPRRNRASSCGRRCAPDKRAAPARPAVRRARASRAAASPRRAAAR